MHSVGVEVDMTATRQDLKHHIEHDGNHVPSSEQRTTMYILLVLCYLLMGVTLFSVWAKVNLG